MRARTRFGLGRRFQDRRRKNLQVSPTLGTCNCANRPIVGGAGASLGAASGESRAAAAAPTAQPSSRELLVADYGRFGLRTFSPGEVQHTDWFDDRCNQLVLDLARSRGLALRQLILLRNRASYICQRALVQFRHGGWPCPVHAWLVFPRHLDRY